MVGAKGPAASEMNKSQGQPRLGSVTVMTKALKVFPETRSPKLVNSTVEFWIWLLANVWLGQTPAKDEELIRITLITTPRHFRTNVSTYKYIKKGCLIGQPFK